MLPALVEVLHHHTDKHVQDEEADDQQEGDEVQQHPGAVIDDGLNTDGVKTLNAENITDTEEEFIVLFVKDALNGSKVTFKTFIM